MTTTFHCNGCSVSLNYKLLAANLVEIDHKNDTTIPPWNDDAYDLCPDCYKATKEFLKERYNKSGKGVNTGRRTSRK